MNKNNSFTSCDPKVVLFVRRKRHTMWKFCLKNCDVAPKIFSGIQNTGLLLFRENLNNRENSTVRVE